MVGAYSVESDGLDNRAGRPHAIDDNGRLQVQMPVPATYLPISLTVAYYERGNPDVCINEITGSGALAITLEAPLRRETSPLQSRLGLFVRVS
jgi:hypothetical protein